MTGFSQGFRGQAFACTIGVLVLAGSGLAAPERDGKVAVAKESTTQPAPAANSPTTRPASTGKGVEAESILRQKASAGDRPSTVPSVKPGGLEFGRVATALAVVLGLIFILRWAGRKIYGMPAGRRASRVVQVLSRTPVAPRQHVMLMQVGRRVVVIADSGGQLSSLCQITDPDEVSSLVTQILDEKADIPSSFGQLFGKMKDRFEPQAGQVDEEPVEPESPAVSKETEALVSTRNELSGLAEKVRTIARQFKVG